MPPLLGLHRAFNFVVSFQSKVSSSTPTVYAMKCKVTFPCTCMFFSCMCFCALGCVLERERGGGGQRERGEREERKGEGEGEGERRCGISIV